MLNGFGNRFFRKHNMNFFLITSFVIDLENENKNTRKGVMRLVIVFVALRVAYCLPPTLLQANKGTKHDFKS
jgi:hypothetical protein